MKLNKYDVIRYSNEQEDITRGEFIKYFRECPIPDDEILSNAGLFLNSKALSRILFMDHIYRQIVDVQGVVMEFGTRWGQNASLFTSLRGIYEPFNRHRKIVAFDTFKGFPVLTYQDGKSVMMKKGALSVNDDYINYLDKILALQENDNPISHIKKYEIRPGDACDEIVHYLKEHTETIIALAYFDFDLYEPTKRCLEAIRPHLVKGGVLAFDELNDPDSPGETVALREVFGLNNISLKRYRYTSRVSYFVVE